MKYPAPLSDPRPVPSSASPTHSPTPTTEPVAHPSAETEILGLARTLSGPDFEAARAAHRDLARRVRHAGRPGNRAERRACSDALLTALQGETTPQTRRQLLWLISEISGDEAVSPVADLLTHPELRDDARMVLERLPGKRSLKALETALGQVPIDFRRALAVSLRARGVSLQGLPSEKLVPTRSTRVQPRGNA